MHAELGEGLEGERWMAENEREGERGGERSGCRKCRCNKLQILFLFLLFGVDVFLSLRALY